MCILSLSVFRWKPYLCPIFEMARVLCHFLKVCIYRQSQQSKCSSCWFSTRVRESHSLAATGNEHKSLRNDVGELLNKILLYFWYLSFTLGGGDLILVWLHQH